MEKSYFLLFYYLRYFTYKIIDYLNFLHFLTVNLFDLTHQNLKAAELFTNKYGISYRYQVDLRRGWMTG